MLGYAQRADVGIVGATLLYRDNTIQHTGAVIGLNGAYDHVLKKAYFRFSERVRYHGPNGILLASRDVSAVTAACLLVRADVFDRLAGFDEELSERYYDIDLCLRARALGFKVIQDAYAVLYHEENEINDVRPGTPQWDDLQRFLTRNKRMVFSGDPFYSPLLSTTSTDMALAPAARSTKRLRPRTTSIILPGRAASTKSLRVDSASLPRPIVHHARIAASAQDRHELSSPWKGDIYPVRRNHGGE
jgi:hypothetical protein